LFWIKSFFSGRALNRIHFVTGKLAELALRQTLESLAKQVGFAYTVQVLPITVAALMTPAWIARRLEVPEGTTLLILPGYCDGDLTPLRQLTAVPIEIGPKDLRRLPEFFGMRSTAARLDRWDIEIIAEINHAPRLDLQTILDLADKLRQDGADLIDVGCEPDSFWPEVGQVVGALKEAGHRVSVDSLNPQEISLATAAGAELVLSVNASNREFAEDWGCEVVVIPDQIREVDSLNETVEFLAERGVPFRIDPVLEPIGLGFAQSLRRYFAVADRWPEARLMMGIGNLTELSDCDSAGINLLLLAICQELRIGSVLTTQVINWARSSVRECDIARRLVYHAIEQGVPPKHLSDQLITLRDPKLVYFEDQQLTALAESIRDNNYRIFAQPEQIHLMGGGVHLSGKDPFELFDQLTSDGRQQLDPDHAFYLGFELAKAELARQLGKQYVQDEALHWGYLTEEEVQRHRLKRRKHRPSDRLASRSIDEQATERTEN
jgi:dihydropteroate synthase